jgi:hypothetical protein
MWATRIKNFAAQRFGKFDRIGSVAEVIDVFACEWSLGGQGGDSAHIASSP